MGDYSARDVRYNAMLSRRRAAVWANPVRRRQELNLVMRRYNAQRNPVEWESYVHANMLPQVMRHHAYDAAAHLMLRRLEHSRARARLNMRAVRTHLWNAHRQRQMLGGRLQDHLPAGVRIPNKLLPKADRE